jgi:hypothetical protein
MKGESVNSKKGIRSGRERRYEQGGLAGEKADDFAERIKQG